MIFDSCLSSQVEAKGMYEMPVGGWVGGDERRDDLYEACLIFGILIRFSVMRTNTRGRVTVSALASFARACSPCNTRL
jgi:hypothetical protein